MRTDLVQIALAINTLAPVAQPKKFQFPDQFMEIWAPDSGLVDVPAGTKVTVFNFTLPKGLYGVIRKRCWTYYGGDELYFIVDLIQQYDEPVKYSLGEYPNTTVPVLIPFANQITVEVKNNDVDNHWYGVICGGHVANIADKDLLLEIISRGVI